MKRIGILTFHYVNNYGAVLQTYALRKVINQLPGCKAEIINYVPEGYAIYPYGQGEDEKRLMIEKRKLFENFLKTNCGIDSPMISSVTGNHYDYYCVGSDQVWNYDLRENMNLEYFFPNLDFDAVKIAYAASIGIDINKLNKNIFQRYLPEFRKISLREGQYIDYIKSICNVSCEKVLDPTLLLDRKDFELLIDTNKRVDKPYILVFWYKLDENLMGCVEFANTLARKYGLAIVHTIVDAPSYMFCNDAGCMMYEGIEGFLWYMKHAEFVITNSFHGSIFAMQFERPLYIFISELRRSRLDELVGMMGIEDRVVNGYLSPEKLNDDVDYGLIKEKLSEQRKLSLNFLKEAFELLD